MFHNYYVNLIINFRLQKLCYFIIIIIFVLYVRIICSYKKINKKKNVINKVFKFYDRHQQKKS
jgi:hypothetical protein